MNTTLEQALDLTFETYIEWCHDFCNEKAKTDPIFQDVILTAPATTLESVWARRYWFHHCNKIKV